MTVMELMRTLRGRRVTVWNEHGKLRYRAPEGALTGEIRDLMRLHRPSLLAIIPSQEPAAEPVPASFAQQAMWFLNRAMPESPAYNVAFAARIQSAVDVDALRRAAQALIDRHGSLRTLYEEDDGAPAASVHASLPVEFRQIDAAAWDEATLYPHMVAAYRVPFDLERGPLVRFDLFTRAPADHALLISAHHIAMDGWSVWLMLDELRVLYAAASGTAPATLPPIATDYAEYAQWQAAMVAGEEGSEHCSYWEGQLAGELPALELPTDHPRVPNRAPQGASHRLAIGLERTARIKALAREEGATLFAVLLSAYAILLSRYTGERDIVVGTPTSGRTQSRFEGVLGCFVNPVALRVRCDEGLSFRSLLGQVRATVLGALAHQDYPFRLIAEKLRTGRTSARGQLFQVDFALQKPQRFTQLTDVVDDIGDGQDAIDFGGLRMRLYDMPQQEGQLDLTLELIESRGALVGSFKYDGNLFEPDTIARMECHLLELVDAILLHPDQPISALSMLPPAERQRLLVDFNATDASFPSDRTYTEYFEEQVRRTPDAVALVDDEGSLTYAELNARADHVARTLVAAGVDAGQPVALFAERGRALLTWILATFKAGGAYLPLDPRIPAFRHAEILRQSRAPVVLVADSLVARVDAALVDLAAADRPTVLQAHDLAGEVGDASDLPPRARPGDLAYIIFTSGSTGRPKGAMVPHRAMLNHFWSKIRGYALTSADVVVQSAPQGFDISVWQFLAVLLAGGRVRIAPDAVTHEPARLFAFVESEGVTILELVPSALRAWLDELPPGRGRGRSAGSGACCLARRRSRRICAGDGSPGGRAPRCSTRTAPANAPMTRRATSCPQRRVRANLSCRSGARSTTYASMSSIVISRPCRTASPASCASAASRWDSGTSTIPSGPPRHSRWIPSALSPARDSTGPATGSGCAPTEPWSSWVGSTIR